LYGLREDGETSVFSRQLAAMAGGTAAQVRRDMMAIGYSGSPTRGYNIEELIRSIASFLDAPEGQHIALAGVGHLGLSILANFAGRRPKLSIVAAFDVDPAKINREIHGCPCYHIDQIDEIVREKNIDVGILTVSESLVHDVTDRFCRAGVRGLLNFTPARLHVPKDVDVEDYDIAMCLEKVAYFARQNGTRGQE
jgi:redox-sensing transcriptional repressor